MAVAIETLAYSRSRYEPCIYCLMEDDGPSGHLLLHVDDIAEQGNEKHRTNMQKLRETLKFGKWIHIYDSQADYCGRTIIQDKDHSFRIHLAKIITERLEYVVRDLTIIAFPSDGVVVTSCDDGKTLRGLGA